MVLLSTKGREVIENANNYERTKVSEIHGFNIFKGYEHQGFCETLKRKWL